MVPTYSDALRIMDPSKTLVLVGGLAEPAGAVGTWGFGNTSYLRAMGDPRALAELGVQQGILKKTTTGYVDAQTGADVPLESIDSYRKDSGSRVGFEKLMGPREIGAAHKMVTRHGGLIPEFLRRGVADYMGISRADKMVGRAPLGMQLSVLTGARYLAGLGATLPELFSDPRDLSVLASSALPGTEAFVEAARASGQVLDGKLVEALRQLRRLADSSPDLLPEHEADVLKIVDDLLANPVVGRNKTLARTGTHDDVMRISHILGSGVGTVFSNMIGPSGALRTQNILDGYETLGPEIHHTGECATFFGTLRAAASMLRADPDFFQVPKMILVGASEAGFAIHEARILSYLFDAMKAMESTDHVYGRGADLWTGYAPLSQDVGGFWPGEAAVFLGLTTVAYAREKRLRMIGELSGVGASADQGRKTHPAGLGKGGYNSLIHALQVAGRSGVRINYANIHGTGTQNNNEEEPKSLAQVARALGYEDPIRLYADKANSTHTLGASGGLAMAGTLFGLLRGALPGTAHMQGRLVDGGIDLGILSVDASAFTDIEAVLFRSQGFWGNNEDAVVLPVREGYLQRRFKISSKDESDYWAGVQERDARGAENIARLDSERDYLGFLSRVRFA